MDCIIKPCDWETIYLKTEQNPNNFGEALRQYCFIGNCMERGCYSTFDLLPKLKEVKSGNIYEEAKNIILPKFVEPDNLKVYYFKVEEKDCYIDGHDEMGNSCQYKINEPYELVVAWHWDGDGTLYFRWNDRAVINYDCKCDYYWDWC